MNTTRKQIRLTIRSQTLTVPSSEAEKSSLTDGIGAAVEVDAVDPPER